MGSHTATLSGDAAADSVPAAKKPFYRQLYVQVLAAIAVGATLGHLAPELGTALKPLGDGFIKLVKMIIAPVIFLTVATGIAFAHRLRLDALQLADGRYQGALMAPTEVLAEQHYIGIRAFVADLIIPDDATLLDRWIFAGRAGTIDCVWRAGVKRVAGGRHVDRSAIAAAYRKSVERIVA